MCHRNRMPRDHTVALQRRYPWRLALMALSLAIVAHASRPSAAEGDDPGKDLYVQSCAPCHGLAGKGGAAEAAPVAAFLTTPPPDLTQLAKNNKGDFPFIRVMEVIDGRQMLSRAHGTSEMPVWGEQFSKTGARRSQGAEVVAGRVLLLTEYVRSIQEK